jgi:hypothetical protein
MTENLKVLHRKRELLIALTNRVEDQLFRYQQLYIERVDPPKYSPSLQIKKCFTSLVGALVGAGLVLLFLYKPIAWFVVHWLL